MAMTYSGRAVTPRVLFARARQHRTSLTVFPEREDWSAVQWPAVVDDPEWIYHESAIQACTAVSTRLFSEALGLPQWVPW